MFLVYVRMLRIWYTFHVNWRVSSIKILFVLIVKLNFILSKYIFKIWKILTRLFSFNFDDFSKRSYTIWRKISNFEMWKQIVVWIQYIPYKKIFGAEKTAQPRLLHQLNKGKYANWSFIPYKMYRKPIID